MITEERDSLRRESENIERERDFYFDKLRRIEEYCQHHPDNEMSSAITAVLFALSHVTFSLLFLLSYEPEWDEKEQEEEADDAAPQ